MAILREKTTWRREPSPNTLASKNRLTAAEEVNVRAAMVVLLIRFGNWRQVAKALKTDRTTITRVICIRKRASAAFTVRVARLLGEPVGDVLTGAFPRPGECPMCAGTGKHGEEWAWRRHLTYSSGKMGGAPAHTRRTPRS